jgi:uncharacterized protein
MVSEMRNALILQGDCPCHPSREVADIIGGELEATGLAVEMAHGSMDAVLDRERMGDTDLIVMQWHKPVVTPDQEGALLAAVYAGTGIAGVHAFVGGGSPAYHYMTGGHWVAHPGDDGVTYRVRIEDARSPITEGIPDFTVTTEKYYMHVDPAIHVLAATEFGEVSMPVAWTKEYGKGRVFYHSLGHLPNIVRIPEVLRLTRQGMRWAAR